MICNKCNNTSPDGNKFCVHCGSKFETETVILPPVAPTTPQNEKAVVILDNKKSMPVKPKKEKRQKSGNKAFALATIITLALIIVGLAVLSAIQYIKIQELNDEVSDAEDESKSKKSTISRLTDEKDDLADKVAELENVNDNLESENNSLENKVDSLEAQARIDKEMIDFVNDYVVFIEDDGTELYHKYDCIRFKGESFWVYNLVAAENRGYTKCYYCH